MLHSIEASIRNRLALLISPTADILISTQRISAETSTVHNRKPKDLAANFNSLMHILLSCPANVLISAYVTFCHQGLGVQSPLAH